MVLPPLDAAEAKLILEILFGALWNCRVEIAGFFVSLLKVLVTALGMG